MRVLDLVACVALVSCEQLCVFGGFTPYSSSSYVVYSSVECTMDAGVSWTEVAPLPTPRMFHAATAWQGEACILGGVEQYKDTENVRSTVECWAGHGEWHSLPSMQWPRFLAVALVWKNQLCVVGGEALKPFGLKGWRPDPECFNGSSWVALPSPPFPVRDSKIVGGAVVYNDFLCTIVASSGRIFCYDGSSWTNTTIPGLSTLKSPKSLVAWGDKVCVLGGLSETQVECYAEGAGWSALPDLPSPRLQPESVGSAVLDDMLCLVGGEVNADVTCLASPVPNGEWGEWIVKTPMSVVRAFPGLVVWTPPTPAPTAPMAPTFALTTSPTAPTSAPTTAPTVPTFAPATSPTALTSAPTTAPTVLTFAPTNAPMAPTSAPTTAPTVPTEAPTTCTGCVSR